MVQSGWEKIKNADAEGMANNVHKNAIMWWGSGTAPHRVEMLKGPYGRWFAYEKVTDAELQPLRIEIFDDVALIAYYASWTSDKRSAKVKYLVVYMKQDDKWMAIGNLASMCGKPPACLKMILIYALALSAISPIYLEISGPKTTDTVNWSKLWESHEKL